MTDLRGLTVRWSLAGAPDGVEEALAAYVAETSYDRFSAMPDLAFKTWRSVPGEWYSPTQPVPTKPAPFDRTGIGVDDLIDFTPELRAKALEIAND